MEADNGQYLRRLRQAVHLSQEEIAKAAHVDRSMISLWESGKRHASDEYLQLLAELNHRNPEDVKRIYLNDATQTQRQQDDTSAEIAPTSEKTRFDWKYFKKVFIRSAVIAGFSYWLLLALVFYAVIPIVTKIQHGSAIFFHINIYDAVILFAYFFLVLAVGTVLITALTYLIKFIRKKIKQKRIKQ